MKELTSEYQTNVDCPPNEIALTAAFKKNAWLDHQNPKNERDGFLNCYCQAYQSVNGFTETVKASFKEFSKNGVPDEHNYCNDWLISIGLE